MKRTEIGEIGEFGLIERIKAKFPLMHKETRQGIGDDAAVIDTGGDDYQLVSTDMLLENIHFDLSYTPLKHLGYKAVVVNLSDIVAMNGIPKQVVIGMALSNRFSVEAVDEIYEGIKAACDFYKVDLAGGDTTASQSGLLISVTALGTVPKDRITYRRSAAPQEVICVTGDLGAAYMGLQSLAQEKQEFLVNPEMQPQLEGKDYIIGRQLRPEARLDIINEFRILDLIPTTMMDISDGLASELFHICHQSKVGAMIFEERLPIDRLTYETAIGFKLDPSTAALNGGEDYELLFTLKAEEYAKIEQHEGISPIGYVVDASEGIRLQTRGGNLVDIQAQGWKHF